MLKRGREGVRVLRRGADPVDVPAATAAAVDQTGAGDAFAAGYLAALVRGEDDAACARAAVRAATEAVGRPGRPAAVGRCSALLGGDSRPGIEGEEGRRSRPRGPPLAARPPSLGDWPRGAADHKRQAGPLPQQPQRDAANADEPRARVGADDGPISETKSGSLPKISRPLATRRSQTSGAWMCWMTQPSAPSSWRDCR